MVSYRSVYGDAIGRKTLRMTQIAKSVGAYANNSGSGGSVLALCPKGQMQVYALTGDTFHMCRKPNLIDCFSLTIKVTSLLHAFARGSDLCTKEGFKIEQVVIAPKKFTPS